VCGGGEGGKVAKEMAIGQSRGRGTVQDRRWVVNNNIYGGWHACCKIRRVLKTDGRCVGKMSKQGLTKTTDWPAKGSEQKKESRANNRREKAGRKGGS